MAGRVREGLNYLKNKAYLAVSVFRKGATAMGSMVKRAAIHAGLQLALGNESDIFIRLIDGVDIREEDYTEDHILTNSSKIIDSLTTFLVSSPAAAETAINTIVDGYAPIIYEAVGTRNIILELSKLETVNLNNNDSFLSDIEDYLYRKTKPLTPQNKTNLVRILQLVVDVLKILKVLDPFPFLTEAGDKLPGMMIINLLISILKQTLDNSIHSFYIEKEHEGRIIYEWNKDISIFTPYSEPFNSDCRKITRVDNLESEETSNKHISVMIFIVVLLKRLTEKLVELKTSENRAIETNPTWTETERTGGSNKQRTSIKKPKKNRLNKTRKERKLGLKY